MPRSPRYTPIWEEQARKIRLLKDDLYMARRTIVELMPEKARSILNSYYETKSKEDWYRWPDQAAEQIIELCTDVTQRTYQGYLYEERAKCPLCGDGPQSFYDGHVGFKLPEGLRRHLTGYGRSRECSVFGAVRALGREHYQDRHERLGEAPNWATMNPKSEEGHD